MECLGNRYFRGLLLCGLYFLGVIGILASAGGSSDEETLSLTGEFDEKVITSAGGDLFIVDENNNSINVIFPENAVSRPSLISLSFMPGGADSTIQTQHLGAFEIKPHDLQIYRPVSVWVDYDQPVADFEYALLYRQKSGQMLIPLADHKYFQDQFSGGQSLRAFTRTAGVFKEGIMSPAQLLFQLNAILDLMDLDLLNLRPAFQENTCDTDINKSVWEAWKEFGNGAEQLVRVAQLMEVQGIVDLDLDEMALIENVCDSFANSVAQSTVLGKCIPDDICDHNYRYVIFDALGEVQRCGSVGEPVYDALYSRYQSIINTCIEDGTLNFQLSGQLDVLDSSLIVPARLVITYKAESVSVPLSIQQIHESGTAEIDDNYSYLLDGVPLFSLSGAGSIIYDPGSDIERTCDVFENGYLVVDVGGIRDSLDSHDLAVITKHYLDQTIDCAWQPTPLVYPLRHRRTIPFDISLNPQNSFMGTAQTASDVYSWTINAELKLP